MENGHKKPIISKTPEDIGNPQANWDRKKFDDLIFDKGYKCHIERALKCPCTNEVSGQADSDCLNCLGSGWFFIDKTETVVVCTSMSSRSKYENWSESNSGTVSVSSRAQDKLGFMDRITLIELESWFSQTLRLKTSLTKQTKLFSFLIYNPISIFQVYLFIDSQTPLKPLRTCDYIIDGNKIVLEKSIIQSYINIENPKITIRYTHNPTYHVIDVNRDLIKQKSIVDCNNDSGSINFPLNCIGKRAHYILDNPNFNGDGVFDNTNYQKKVNNYDI
jgi:hypothetical protein